MEKIELGTADGATENIEKIAELFPQVMTETKNAEGELERVVDFDALRDLLGDVAEGQRERYQFTWPGKREAKAEARRPIYKTMIPEPGKSKDWDTTENLYIEGDNLDALKILKETYAGKVKLIYIDPPYNTGHDFVYDDDFAKTRGEYDAESGDYNEEGGRLVANPESNGRFHSDWCSMMYPRLALARDLLTADGAIFISIDDNEVNNLLNLMNELFGQENEIATFVWEKMYTTKNDSSVVSNKHEYVCCFAKSVNTLSFNLLPRSDEMDARYTNPDNDPRGPWKAIPLYANGERKNGRYEVVSPSTGTIHLPKPNSHWRYRKEDVEKLISDNRIYFGADGLGQPNLKRFLSEVKQGINVSSLWKSNEAGTNDSAKKDIRALFDGDSPFDFPKPLILMRRILDIASSDECTILDFFSGSASMAQAVMEKNAEDGGNRRFVLVQIPEETTGQFSTLTEIGEERIRRAGAKIAAEIDESNKQLELGADPKPYPDLGFRVIRIDSSNFKDFYLTPGETSQESLFDFADNVKKGRSDLDLLFEVLPKLGIPYSAKIEERMLAGKKVFFVDGDKLAACFDANVGSDTIEEMAKAKPWYAVIRDSSMADDATHANYEELFRTYSPDTVPQVI